MARSLDDRLTGLATMSRAQLVREWERALGEQAPAGYVDTLLARGIAQRLQEKAYGGLSQRHAGELRRLLARGQEAAPNRDAGLPPGSRLAREWHGRTHRVVVLADGYEYDGRRYASLSAIAREITGARWSGPRFFGLNGRRKVSAS